MELSWSEGTHNRVFDDVMQVRRSADSGPSPHDLSDPMDTKAYHYVIRNHSHPIACVSIHRANESRMDCEAFYPGWIRQHFDGVTFSCVKLRVRSDSQYPLKALRMIVRGLWTHQLSLGGRLCVINATETLAKFYQRIGFVRLQHPSFVHPKLGTHSSAWIMLADPRRRSFCTDLFSKLSDPMFLEEALVIQERASEPVPAIQVA